MKKILVPTDFSACADRAAEVAFELAKKDQAEVHFIHLVDIPVDWVNLVETGQNNMYPDVTAKVKEINDQLDVRVNKAAAEGVSSKKFVFYNCNYKYIIEHVKNFNCDFVVMGSHGSSGLTEWFIGSNTQRVVRTSPVPVMVVKGDKPFLPMDAIVFSSEFEQDTLQGFKKVVDFALALGVKIHMVFINTPGNFTETVDIEARMEKYTSAVGQEGVIAGTWVYNAFDFEKGLVTFVETHGSLIAMVTHGTKGSLTERIINHVDLPVLSVLF